jgi:UDP-N-acetylglucosamine kinase
MAFNKGDLSTYRLSDAESQQIFQEQIVPKELGHLQNPANDASHEDRPPLAVFVIGQTGAGKTRAAPAIKQVMQGRRGEPAHLIADTFKTFHPAYQQLVSESPAQASPATGPDARRWLVMAVSHAMDRRADLLIESACRYPQDFAELARMLHGDDNPGGYRVEVMILAVPAALSWLGILTRYYERLPEAASRDLPMRLTPRKVHDESYAGLFDAAKFVDESGAVNQVVVVRRGDLVAYTNERVDGSWEAEGSAAEALVHERQRALPGAEQSTAEEDIARLRKLNLPELESAIPDIEPLAGYFDTTSDERQLRDLLLPRKCTAHVRFGTKVDLSLGLDIP